MVETNAGFSLEAYLRDISCTITFSDGETMEFEEVSYTSLLVCEYTQNQMVHGFGASGQRAMKEIKNSVGKLRLDYHISFTGHPSEESDFKEYMVPVIKRPSVYDL